MTFRDEANAAQVTWKHSTAALPEAARADGEYRRGGPTYGVCLPWEYADHNLIPEVRKTIIARFERDGIAWHQGTDVGVRETSAPPWSAVRLQLK